MTVLDYVFGGITTASFLFAVWVFLQSRQRQAVERERITSQHARFSDLLRTIIAMEQQGALIANIADRDETTKKELKHLAIAQLQTSSAARGAVEHELKLSESWRFGTPSQYIVLESGRHGEAEPGSAGPEGGHPAAK